jgi:parvulin-like peptidyl-prolyl isomerase
MKFLSTWISIAIAALAGIACAELAIHSIIFRDKLGGLFGRGQLLAVVHGHGICQSDVDRALRESDYASDIERSRAPTVERRSALNKLIANIAAQSNASSEKISETQLKHDVDLLRYQFPSDKSWRQALNVSNLSGAVVSRTLRDNLRTREWISKQIAPALGVTETECRRFYDSHQPDFIIQERRGASHLFLAAPPESAQEIVEAKRVVIQSLAVRLAAGEDFATLVAQNSEDEATKLRGGDLDYFSEKRMPPDFVAAAMRLQTGEISPPVQTRLGFHIIKLTDVQPARQRTFDEAREEIVLELQNQKRAAAIQKLVVDLSSQVEYRRPF